MARTQVRSEQLGNSEVKREDLNVTEVGQSVITRILAGTGITLSSTGADSGTGDVTINSSAELNIHDLTEKVNVSLFDYFVIEDSDDNYSKKKVTMLTFLSALLSGFKVDGGLSTNTNMVFVDGGLSTEIYAPNQIIDGGIA